MSATDLTAITDAALMCREMGHSWLAFNDTRITRNVRGRVIEFTRKARCRGCKAERSQVIEVGDFTVRTSSITYPTGYLVSGYRPRKPQVRQEVYRRLVEGRS